MVYRINLTVREPTPDASFPLGTDALNIDSRFELRMRYREKMWLHVVDDHPLGRVLTSNADRLISQGFRWDRTDVVVPVGLPDVVQSTELDVVETQFAVGVAVDVRRLLDLLGIPLDERPFHPLA